MPHPPVLEQNQTAAVPHEKEGRYEIINGERQDLEPMGAFEVALASALNGILDSFGRRQKLGVAVTEMLFVLHAERNLKRRPDVAFVSYSRWPEPSIPRTEAWDVVPDLAVEIISPTNLAAMIDAKLTDYFAAGVRLVWVVYPDSGRVYVYQSPTHVAGLERSDELDGGDVLPGFRLPIERLFDAVTRPD